MTLPLLLAGALATLSGGVLLVDDDPYPLPDFHSIQAALDAALPGDTVLVRPGTYAAFEIAAKGVSVVGIADASGRPRIGGASATVAVRDVPAGQVALVRGFELEGCATLERNAGVVLLEDVGLRRLDALQCADAVLVRLVLDSASATQSDLLVYESRVEGGGFDGAPGLLLTDSSAFLSGCSVLGVGGAPGSTLPDGTCTIGGFGGPGLELVGSTCVALDSTFAGGAGGDPGFAQSGPPCFPGFPGQAVVGTGLTVVPGSAHSLAIGAPVEEQGALSIALRGEPGELAFLAVSAALGPQPVGFFVGPGLPALPVSLLFAGAVPPSGELALSIGVGPLNPALERLLAYVQAAFVAPSGLGPDYLSSPTAALLLDELVLLNDCDGNLVDDALDLQSGAAIDCNANGIPDACDVAQGFVLDCNGNLVPDECDVASGASADADGDGVPDECEGVLRVPSQFATIGAAIAAAADGDRILIADGVYTGPGNKQLSLLGKRLVVESENGPAACIVDCEGDGRAFDVSGGQQDSTEIAGLTIRNGLAQTSGGAVRVAGASLVLRNCILRDNAAPAGGALSAGFSAAHHVQVLDCGIVGNRALDNSTRGGGIASSLVQLTVERCLFVDNDCASGGFGDGGGIGAFGGLIAVRDTLFTRNRASLHGGAFAVSSAAQVALVGCTFVENDAFAGGAASFRGDPTGPLDTAVVSNCIFWNDGASAVAGAEIRHFATTELTLGYTLLEGGPAAIEQLGSGADLVLLPGLLDTDPLFVDQAGGDLHLGPLSPCVDAGDPAFVGLPGQTDLEGDPRVLGARVDLGADERAE